MSLTQFGSATAKIPLQGLMKMGDSGACLASVAHNIDKNIPDDAPHATKFGKILGRAIFTGCGWVVASAGGVSVAYRRV